MDAAEFIKWCLVFGVPLFGNGGGGVIQTFTPTLSFGGDAQAMTGTFGGAYLDQGNSIDLQILIALTNKGSATGNAAVGNLPFVVGAEKWLPMFLQNCSATGTTYVNFAAQGVLGNTSLNLFNFSQAASPAVALSNANFTNTSIINISGTYWKDAS